MILPKWSTACPDWQERIIRGDTLIPFDPLFPDEAEAALRIFRDLILVDVAPDATIGGISRQWFLDFAAHVFGSYDADTGRRLIRYFFLLISKKNAKSTLAAGIMLTALLRNWRLSGEYYILAPTKEIADNSYFPARDMVNADDELKTILRTQDNYRTITHRNTGAFLKVVAADSEVVSGKKTIGLFVDELWLFGKKANAITMIQEATGGLASRKEGFVIYASTMADAPPAGIFDKTLSRFRKIRDGKIIDPRSLGVMFEFPDAMLKNKEYRKRENRYITNPNLGASVDEEFLDDQEAKAEEEGPSSVVTYLAKHLNVEITQGLRSDGWAGAEQWDVGAERGLTLDEVIRRSEVLTAGIDGGGLDDLLGVFVLGREKGTDTWLGWAHAFISPQGWKRRKANQEVYHGFITDGDLTLVERLPDDVTAVVDIIKQCIDSGKFACVGCDPAGIGIIVDKLAKIGVTEEAKNLAGQRQGVALMGAIKTVERKLADGSFKHGGRRMMAWCAGNAIVQATGTGMRIARDASGYGKVDPLMAGFDAVAEMSLNPEVAVGNFPADYEVPVWA
jgi:phage terminase large subunit-like protein